MSIFDSNPENERPDPFASTEHYPDPSRHSDDLIREMYADVKVLKHSIRPIIKQADEHDARLSKIERNESKVRGFIAGASAIGAGGLVGAIQALLYRLQNGGH